jgi:hypothetical protein
MATNGFEFAYSLDGSTPVERDFAVNGTGTFSVGDLVTMTAGKLAKAGNTVSTVAAVMMETRTTGTDGQLMKAAILTDQQVWRCSFDATTYSASLGDRTQDIASSRLLDANDATNGSLVIMETRDDPHDPTYPVGYVVFSNVHFGS